MNKPVLKNAILLKDVTDINTIKWVQSKLAEAGYLDKDGVDGIVGNKTIAALREFKENSFLDYPEAIGASTIDALDELEARHEVSEQADVIPTKVNADAGTKTGKSKNLPVVGLVYENEMVFPDTYITWGEMTKGFTRLPINTSQFGSEEQVVKNMIALAKAFGKVRQKFGSPIGINSAYRPPDVAIAGSASNSQHKYARALDVRPLNGDYKGLLEAIKSVPEIKGIGIAGPKKGFWHMDIRHASSRITFPY